MYCKMFQCNKHNLALLQGVQIKLHIQFGTSIIDKSGNLSKINIKAIILMVITYDNITTFIFWVCG